MTTWVFCTRVPPPSATLTMWTPPLPFQPPQDFGLSCFFNEGQLLNEVMGSAFYVAPGGELTHSFGVVARRRTWKG